jgi:hypothetical protein
MRNDLCYVSMVEEDYMFHDSDVQCVKSLKRFFVFERFGSGWWLCTICHTCGRSRPTRPFAAQLQVEL